ncbi:MAG: transglycosylase SLT domain-containing protein [Alphaproteobacteria bacterium]
MIKKIIPFLLLLTFINVAKADILSSSDNEKYRKVFALQQEGKWKQADKIIKTIDNKILMGQVEFQKYMHPTKYRASYPELHNWLKKYNDHPGSKQLYKLAKRRKSGGWKNPTPPKGQLVPKRFLSPDSQNLKFKKAKSKFKSSENAILRKIYRSVQKGNVTDAYSYLNKNRKRLGKPAHAKALSHIARGYYRYHKPQRTITIAQEAYKMNKKESWEANWWAGLEAYREEKYELASTLFERMAQQQEKDTWLNSAGYYWAGRAQDKIGNSMSAQGYWAKAIKHITTFYGILAAKSMGNDPAISFSTNSATDSDLDEFSVIPAIKRARALVEVGMHHRADREFKYIQPQVKLEYQETLMKLGARLNLPHAQYRSGYHLINKGESISYGYLFPDIPYRPKKGFVIDKALVLAFVRQESQFRSYAKSSVGARGLMQLMPNTARFVARKTRVKPNSFYGTRRNYLYRPELSMTLGQSYIRFLLKEQKNNLFYSVASYNAGPGNIKRWRKKVDYKKDPLLFIESMPSRETRLFLEKVVSNFWIYRLKFNGNAPSLDMLADGKWPMYESMD